ncbi:oxidoreductase [Actinomycetota bacterium]|nr:oxidoreductase [Actinomycetota bacterium]
MPPAAPEVDADVVVIGAGQAGLSAAFHLRRIGLRPVGEPGPRGTGTFVVLDAGAGPGGAWRERWPSLTMAHVHGVHELPGQPLPDVAPSDPASRAVSEYFGRYEHDLNLRVERPVQVVAVRDLDVSGGRSGLLAVDTVRVPASAPSRITVGRHGRADAQPAGPRPGARRTWRTRAVINATGTWTKPFWPAYPGRADFAGRQLHTHDFHDAGEFLGRRVIVVGGGTSAVQLLLQIAPLAAATTWVTRRPPAWEPAEFSPELGRAAVAKVDERTRAGLPPRSVVSVTGLPRTAAYEAGIAAGVLLARPMFERLVPDGARWSARDAVGPVADGWVTGPEHVAADVILWCTGFRYALDHLAPLHLRRPGGGIVMDGTEVVADPRLQLVGYGPSASTVGANRAGREAVRNLRRTLAL